MSHNVSCICAICAPESTAAPSLIVQSAPAAVTDVEIAQFVALLKQLDVRGLAMVFAMTQAAVRLSVRRA